MKYTRLQVIEMLVILMLMLILAGLVLMPPHFRPETRMVAESDSLEDRDRGSIPLIDRDTAPLGHFSAPDSAYVDTSLLLRP